MKFYKENVLAAISRLINAMLGGYSGEMLSSRVHRERIFWAIIILDTIFFWDPNHCYNVFIYELENNDRPPEFKLKDNVCNTLLKKDI